MPYKTILTYLPDKKTADRLLNAAMSVARENDAHLVGLHVIPRVPVMYSVAAAEIPRARAPRHSRFRIYLSPVQHTENQHLSLFES